MSRHRDIRNINLHDELDDDALDDGGDEQMTFEQEEQMKYALADVHHTIGPAETTGISDHEIKDALWEYYFDVDKTVQWALDEVERRRVAAERRAHGFDPQNPPTHDQGYADPGMYGQPPMRSGPKIFEHQQNLTLDIPEADHRRRGWDLSTIAEEQSVLTATSTRWTNHAGDPDFPEMYEPDLAGWQSEQLDPNTSRPSPTLSGLARLSEFHDAPSNSSINPDTDDSPVPIRLSSSTPRDSVSEASSAGTERPKSGSKLARLASAKSADAASVSSRSSGTSVKGSIKTFPNLRPSAQSERPTSMVSSVSSKSLPPLPSRSHSTTPSETSHLIRGAIETAMQLEAFDNEQLSRAPPMQPASSSSGNVQPVSTPPSTDHPPQPTSRPLSMQSDRASTVSSASTAKPISKLAALAQQKAALKSKSPATPSPPLSLPSPTSSISAPRSLSKLGQLAQEKVDATKAPKLPKTTTEYLTPIANGSSVTTAITTSYHSLFTLTDPNKRPIIPALDVVPLSFAPPPSPSEKKTSKLAQKSKRPAQNAIAQTSPIEGIDTSAIPSALFQIQGPSPRASPSVFASTLINTDHPASKKGKEKKKKSKGREESPEKRTPEPSPVDSHPRRKHKQTASLPPRSESQTSQSFSFDGPSPDDIVLNARKGKAFRSSLSATSSSRPTSTSDSRKQQSKT